jgi:hypothetical protein
MRNFILYLFISIASYLQHNHNSLENKQKEALLQSPSNNHLEKEGIIAILMQNKLFSKHKFNLEPFTIKHSIDQLISDTKYKQYITTNSLNFDPATKKVAEEIELITSLIDSLYKHEKNPPTLYTLLKNISTRLESECTALEITNDMHPKILKSTENNIIILSSLLKNLADILHNTIKKKQNTERNAQGNKAAREIREVQYSELRKNITNITNIFKAQNISFKIGVSTLENNVTTIMHANDSITTNDLENIIQQFNSTLLLTLNAMLYNKNIDKIKKLSQEMNRYYLDLIQEIDKKGVRPGSKEYFEASINTKIVTLIAEDLNKRVFKDLAKAEDKNEIIKIFIKKHINKKFDIAINLNLFSIRAIKESVAKTTKLKFYDINEVDIISYTTHTLESIIQKHTELSDLYKDLKQIAKHKDDLIEKILIERKNKDNEYLKIIYHREFCFSIVIKKIIEEIKNIRYTIKKENLKKQSILNIFSIIKLMIVFYLNVTEKKMNLCIIEFLLASIFYTIIHQSKKISYTALWNYLVFYSIVSIAERYFYGKKNIT